MEKIAKENLADISSGNLVCKYTCTFISLLIALYFFSNKNDIINELPNNQKIHKEKNLKIKKELSDGYEEAIETFYLRKKILNI